MIETLEELGISPYSGHKEGRLVVGIKDNFIGKAVKYNNTFYILFACSRNYAYLLPKKNRKNTNPEDFGDIDKAQALNKSGFIKRVKRGHCWVPRKERKSKGQLIQEIKESRDLDWRHYASQDPEEGTFVEGRDEEGSLEVCIEL